MADWRNRIVGLEYHKPGEIADHPLQWRVHSTAQEAALRAVLSEVGIAGALLAYRNNGGLVAIDGHLRKSLDADAEWPVLLLDVTEDEANKLLATTDPLAAMAGADAAMLGDLLAVIETENDTLQALLDGLAEEHGIVTEEPPDDPGAQIDKAEELREKWGVELGQVWEIGDHRLVCGDCTDAAVVAAVMRGERAQLAATSPPYWVGKDYEKGQSWDEFLALLDGAVSGSVAALAEGGYLFVNFSENTNKPMAMAEVYRSMADRHGLRWHSHRVWKRPADLPIYASTTPRPCNEIEYLHTYRHGSGPEKMRDIKVSSRMLWETRGPEQLGHSAAFPVELVEKPVAIYSDAGAVVLDPFLGSGTTLVACERLGRRGRGIELSPGYCAVSIQRLADMGLEPRLADG